MANGSSRKISHVKESTWGTPGGTAFTVDRALADASIAIRRSSFVSSEFRADRGIGGHKLGVKQARLPIPFELSFGAQEDYIESALMAGWAAAGTPSGALTATVVAGTTNTIAATGIDTGISVGDWIKVSGFTAGNVKNNGFWKVTAKASGVLTLVEAKDAAGASMLTACASVGSIIVTKMGSIASGSMQKSLSFEEARTDINAFFEMLGADADTFSLSIRPNAIVTGQVEFIGKEVVGPQGTQFAVSYTAAPTNPPIDTFSGFARVDGQGCGVVTGLELSLKNSKEAFFPILQTAAYRIGAGRSDLTGSLSLYFIDSTWYTKYLAETPFSLSIMLMEASGAQGYAIDIPNCKITDLSKQVTENNIVLSVPFQALPDSASGLINWKISKLA